MLTSIRHQIKYPSQVHMTKLPVRSDVMEEPIPKAVKQKVAAMTSPEEEEPWKPSDTLEQTLSSLPLFIDFRCGVRHDNNATANATAKVMKKKLIRESFDNLDAWIEDMANLYMLDYKMMENDSLK